MLKPYSEKQYIDKIKGKINWNDTNLSEIRKLIKEYLKGICDCKCFYCQNKIDDDIMTIEHIVGKDDYKIFTYKPENLILSCKECNTLKNDSDVFTDEVNKSKIKTWSKYPFESRLYKIVHPYIDEYGEYIKKEGIKYKAIGINEDKGKYTIELYKLYRLSLAERNAILFKREIEVDKITKEEEKIRELIDSAMNNNENNPEKVLKMTKEFLSKIKEKLYIQNEPINIRYKQFNEFVLRKFGDSQLESFSEDAKSKINEINRDIISNFYKVDKNYVKQNDLSIFSKKELEDSFLVLFIIEENLHYSKCRKDVQAICSYDFNEITRYYSQDIYINSENKLLLQSMKYIFILKILKEKGVVKSADLLHEQIKKELEIIENLLSQLKDVVNSN